MLPEGSSLSNWEKPGGKTGMVVLGLLGAGGLMLFYKALPFLITLASNTLYLGLLLGLIAGIIYLLCDPKFRKICSATYFMLMRKLTGLVIEIDPIVMKREIQNTILDIYYNAKFDPTILNVTHSIEEAVYLSNRIYILAPNPCKVQAVIDVNFDGRRTDAIRQTTAFANYVKQVEQVMSETHE